jgi:PAS domain-containing protein
MEVRAKAVKVRNGAPVTPQGEQSAFLQNILESSTEYSIIGKDLHGKIQLWNAGASRLYGYEVEVLRATSVALSAELIRVLTEVDHA